MTEAQIWSVVAAALVTAAGIIGTTIKSSAKIIAGSVAAFRERIGKALDDNTESNRERVKAERVIGERFVVLETKIDQIHDWVHNHTPVHGVPVFEPAPDEHPSQRRRIDPPSERRRNGHSIDAAPDLSVPYHYSRPRR